MSYQPTTLIARRGYGSMGDATSCGPGQEWDAGCTFNGIKGQCVPAGTKGKNPNCSYSSSGTLSQIGGFFKDLLGGALNIYNQGQQAKGAQQAYNSMQPQASATPSWVMPVAVGAVGLAAVVLITKKRSNPARRRRRRR